MQSICIKNILETQKSKQMCLCLVLKTCFKLSVSVQNMNEASECAWSSLDRSLWGAPDHRGEPCLPACTYTPAAAWKWCKPGDAQEVFSQIHKTGRRREVQTLPRRHLSHNMPAYSDIGHVSTAIRYHWIVINTLAVLCMTLSLFFLLGVIIEKYFYLCLPCHSFLLI